MVAHCRNLSQGGNIYFVIQHNIQDAKDVEKSIPGSVNRRVGGPKAASNMKIPGTENQPVQQVQSE